MKKIILTLCMAMAMFNGAVKAQEADTPKGHGEAILTLFQHVGVDYNLDNKAWGHPGFQMERAYFGYRYYFDNAWMATVIFDASQGNGTVGEHAFVKNAFVQYRNNNLTVKAGILPTEQGLAAEKCWGYRYVNKAFYDMNGWGQTADLGIMAKYQFTNWFSADLWMTNGEGFRNLQLDNHFLYALGLNFEPVDGLNIRLYADTKTCDTILEQTAQQNLSLFAGYDQPKFRIGAEYNMQFNYSFAKHANLNGLSLFGTYKATPKINIFARYDVGTSRYDVGTSRDDLDSPIDWHYAKDGHMLICGMEYKINKLISIAPALRYTSDRNGDNGTGTLYGFLSAKVAL